MDIIPLFEISTRRYGRRTVQIPQPILNTFRISENELLNLINRYRGLRTNPSPLPGFDHLNRKVLRKIGL